MEPDSNPLTSSISGVRRIVFLSTVACAILPLGTPADAQTRSTRDTATTYGARLDAKGEPANLNPNRINNRINNRLDARLDLRVERYRPQSSNDPAAAFAVRPTDNARIGTATTLSPLSLSPAGPRAFGTPSSQIPSGGNDDSSPPR